MVKPKKRTRTKLGSTLYFMFEQNAHRTATASELVTTNAAKRFGGLFTWSNVWRLSFEGLGRAVGMF